MTPEKYSRYMARPSEERINKLDIGDLPVSALGRGA